MAFNRRLNQNLAKTSQLRARYKTMTAFIQRRPLGSFFIGMGLLFLVIIVGHFLNQPKAQPEAKTPVKSVKLYSIGSAPKATFQAKIEKAGVVKIVAQTSGIVQSIAVNEGSDVAKGKTLITLASNYQGGNAPGLSAQIANAQYQNVLDTYDQQHDVINKQKDIANSTFNNYTEQQNIASQSANNTNSLISANQTALDTMNTQLTTDRNNGTPAPSLTVEEGNINTLQGAQN